MLINSTIKCETFWTIKKLVVLCQINDVFMIANDAWFLEKQQWIDTYQYILVGDDSL